MHWRAVGYGLLTDYVAVLILVGVGGALPAVSGFYALLAPARLAPLLAGAVAGLAGAVAGGVPSHPHTDWRTAARTGLVHAAAVVGVVLFGGATAVIATTPAGPVLAVAVVAAGVLAWRRWAGTRRRQLLLAGAVLVGIVVTLPGRLRSGFAVLVDGAVLVPRVGAFAFLAPTRYGRGWTLLGTWIALTLLGGVLGGVVATRQ